MFTEIKKWQCEHNIGFFKIVLNINVIVVYSKSGVYKCLLTEKWECCTTRQSLVAVAARVCKTALYTRIRYNILSVPTHTK